MQLSQNGKFFSNFFWHFINLNSTLKIFKTKMAPIANVFLNLRTPKNAVT